MNTAKNFITIYLPLNEIDQLQVGFKGFSNKIRIPNKTEDLNLQDYRNNESKTLTKHISCKCKCRLDGRTCNSDQWWNNDKCRCECKKHVCEKDYVWNPATCNCEN